MTQAYRDYGYSSPEPTDYARVLAGRFVRLVDSLPGVERICDLGCGSGYLAAQLVRDGRSVVGVDASPTGIEVARSHHRHPRLGFVRADVGSEEAVATLGAGSFDAVVSSDVIEHLYRPRALIAAAAGLLRPGGHLLVGTPYHGYLKDLAIAIAGKWEAHHNPNWDGGHIKFFSVRSLRELVCAGGFENARFHFHGRAAFLWKNMICVARRAHD